MKRMLFPLLGTVVFCGCSDEQIKTYKVPKETPVLPVQQASARQVPAQPPEKGFETRLPEGWTEKPGSGMRMVSYAIEGTSIDFYLISLAMGDVPSNVNRWRGQVGLPAESDEMIEQVAERLDVDGHPARYIEIYNEESGRGIIAAIIDLAPQYWYFTAKGSVDELKAHAADIRTFIQSIKLR